MATTTTRKPTTTSKAAPRKPRRSRAQAAEDAKIARAEKAADRQAVKAAGINPDAMPKSSADAKAAVKPRPKKTAQRGSGAAGRKITQARRAAAARDVEVSTMAATAALDNALKAVKKDAQAATAEQRKLVAALVVPGLSGKALDAWIKTGKSSRAQQNAAKAERANGAGGTAASDVDVAQVKAAVEAYVAEAGSSDEDANEKGVPFLDGKRQLHLRAAHLAEHSGLSRADVTRGLRALGWGLKQYPVGKVNGKPSSPAHYYAPAATVTAADKLVPRGENS